MILGSADSKWSAEPLSGKAKRRNGKVASFLRADDKLAPVDTVGLYRVKVVLKLRADGAPRTIYASKLAEKQIEQHIISSCFTRISEIYFYIEQSNFPLSFVVIFLSTYRNTNAIIIQQLQPRKIFIKLLDMP